jgi:hypothetical protein
LDDPLFHRESIMLRKLLFLVVTAGLAKRAWDRYRATGAENMPPVRVEPVSTPEPDSVGSAAAQPVAPASPLAWH